MPRPRSRRPSIWELLGTQAVAKTIALYAACGPLVAAAGGLLIYGVVGEGWTGVRQYGGGFVASSYVAGVLPAAATGAYAAIAPFGKTLRFVGSCAAAGLLFSVVETGIVFLVMGRLEEMREFGFLLAFAGLVGAAASVPCTMILRRWRRGLLHPERVAEVFC